MLFIERIRFLILASILLLVPVLVDLHITLGSGPETKFRFLEYGVLLAAFLTMSLWSVRRRRLRFNLASGGIVVWIAYIVIRCAFDPKPDYAFDVGLKYVSWMLFALLAADACRSQREFIRMLWIAVIGQLGPVVLAVGNIFGQFIYLQWIRGESWIWSNELIGSDRAVIWSSLGNPNYYASYGAILLVFLAKIVFLSRKWWTRSLSIVYLTTVLITIIYTFTRGVWASLIPASFAVLLLLIARQIKIRFSLSDLVQTYWRRVAISAIVGFVILSGVYVFETNTGPLHNVANRFQSGLQLRDASLRSRPLLWYGALRMWRENPVWGRGVGRYSPLFLDTIYQSAQETDPRRIQHVTREMNTIRTDEAHNDYVQILAETGLAGYALFLLVLLSLLARASGALFQPNASRSKVILLSGCTAVVVLIAVQCVYDFPLQLPASAVLFALAVAGIFVLTDEGERPCVTRLSYPIIGASILLTPLLLIAANLIVKHHLASHYLTKGSTYLDNGIKTIQSNPNNAFTNFRLAEPMLRRANDLFPNSGVIQFDIGRLYASQAKVQRDPRMRKRAVQRILSAKETWCVPESYYLLCELYLDDAQFLEAQKMSDVLLLVDPERENANFLAARVDVALRNYGEAAAHLRKELRLHAKNTLAIALLGKIEQEQFNNPGEAASLYQKYLEIEPMSVDVQKRFADVLVRLGEVERARHHYEMALEGARANRLPNVERSINAALNKLESLNAQQEGSSNESAKQ